MAQLDSVIAADELRKQGLYFESSQDSATNSDTSPPPRPITPPNTRPRTAQACDKCRERKTKCSGGRPTCVRCAGRGLICHYSTRSHRTVKTKGPSPTPKKRDRTHVVDGPTGLEELKPHPVQSVADSASSYKPYPPPRPKSPNPPHTEPIQTYIPADRPRPITVQSELTRPLPDPLPVPTVPSPYNYRPLGGPSQGENLHQYPAPRRVTRDPVIEVNAQWQWDAPYDPTSRSLPTSGMARVPDDLHIGGSLSRQAPLQYLQRNNFSSTTSSFNAINEDDDPLGSRSMPFYNSRGQHVSSSVHQRRQPSQPHQDFQYQPPGSTSYSDSSFSSSSSFLEFANSFAPSHSTTMPSSMSASWPPDTSPPQPIQQPQQPLPQRPFQFNGYNSPIGLFDIDEPQYQNSYY